MLRFMVSQSQTQLSNLIELNFCFTGIRVIMFLSNDMTKHIAFYNGKQVYCIFLNQLVVTPLLCP